MTRSTERAGSARISAIMALGLAAIAIMAWLHPGYAGAPPGPAGVVAGPDAKTEAGQHQLAPFGRRHTPSPLIIPDQTIPLRFSHKVHLGAAKLTCVECHASVSTSLRAKDVNLPTEETCLDCHDIEEPAGDPPSDCTTCHPGFTAVWREGADRSDTSQVTLHPSPVVFPAPNLKFNHKAHLDKGVTCDTCHKNLDRTELATRDNALPLMETCIGCHDGDKAADECSTCHLTRPDGKFDTHLAGGRLEPAGWYRDDAHDDDWLTRHRTAAQLGDDYCANCHTQKDCIDCHNGVKKPLRVHPNNWILQHPIAARKNTPDCQSCHKSQTFCVDCHQQTKVVWEEPNTLSSDLRFHPEGWLDAAGRRSSNHHAFEAQRNIRACASCHTEETCLSCHTESTLNVNPHPPGFVSSGACDRMVKKNSRVCAKCHLPGSLSFECR